jgi:NADPH-dependent ferric siderophore reductase
VTRRPFPLHTGVAEVARVTPIAPSMTRFTLRHEAFAGFGVEQPGEIVTLGWPAPGRELVLPEAGWRFPAGNEGQHWRNYTVRAHDPGRSEIDVDFFLHGDAGRAASWALTARAGDEIGFAGPRLHWKGGNGGGWSLLVADETGIPALLAILETLPAGHRATALAEVSDDSERQDVETAADVDLRWLSRDGRPPGTTAILADAVAGLDLPEGAGRVWGGGEARAMKTVRERVREPGRAVQVLGYWKHDATPEEDW